jgi:hypothetical protein
VAIGAIVGWAYDRWTATRPHGPAAQRLGVLLASGFIVGESLFNVGLAGLIVATNNPSPMAVAAEAFPAQTVWIGAIATVLLTLGVYLWTERRARAFPEGT